MKDLDFDELDRAVNSLMTNVPKSTPSPSNDTEKTLNITPTLKEGAQPVFDNGGQGETPAAASSSPVVSDTPAPSPVIASPSSARSSAGLPAARRGGRFMDVVHPSSDMKKSETPVPVSRQGSTIEPLKGSTISEIVPQKQAAPVSAPAVAAEEPKEVTSPVKTASGLEQAAEPSVAAGDWPDPLDIAPVSAPEDKKEETNTVEAADSPAAVEPEGEAPAPLTSPFLPDTKVEKRPLGSVAPEPSTEELEPPVIEEKEPKTVDDPNDQLPADPTAIEPSLPAELQGDLMAVEADTTHDQMKQAHEAAVSPKLPEKTENDLSSKDTSDKPSVSEPSVPSGPTSIPQQYHEEPSTGDQGNGAIFDTDSYHQPLAHPAKKKPGWLWVVWIALILLLGAGGGAALYFLGVV